MAEDYYLMQNGIAPKGCTCECVRSPRGWESYNGPEPAEWEQAENCPVHPLDALYPHYWSTYCIHDLHQDCRQTCKTCQSPCRCPCHTEGADT